MDEMAVCLDYQAVYCDRRRVGISLRMLLLSVLVLLGVLGCRVWLRTEITDLGYDLAILRKQSVRLEREQQELELQLSVLTRRDVLEREGRKRLALAPLHAGQLIRVRQ